MSVKKDIRIMSGGRAFRLDVSAQRLFQENDEYVPLAPKQWELLDFFLANPGKLLTKEQLLGAVWKGQIVTDDAISVAVRSLRSALGDSPKQPLFIETVHSRGYCFIAEIVESPDAVSDTENSAGGVGYRWSFGDDPLLAQLDQMNQKEVRIWLTAVGEDGDRSFHEEKESAWPKLYRFAWDLFESIQTLYGNSEPNCRQALISAALGTPDSRFRVPRMIHSAEDLPMLEKHLSNEENAQIICDALESIGDLASGWDGRYIKSYLSIGKIIEIYAQSQAESVRRQAVSTLARMDASPAKEFLLLEAKEMSAGQIDALFKQWRDELEYWQDLDVWSVQLIDMMKGISRRMPIDALFFDEDGREKDCRYWVLRPLAAIGGAGSSRAIERMLEENHVKPETRVEAAGAHWLATGKDTFLNLIREYVASPASSVAKEWLREIEVSFGPRVVITDYQKKNDLVSGYFCRDRAWTFEVFLGLSSEDGFRDTPMIEIYIFADGIQQWNWPGKEPAWTYGRRLVSDLTFGIEDALANYSSS